MASWRVETLDGKAFVREKVELVKERKPGPARSGTVKTDRVVIVGGGAAGFAAAEMLRREGFAGSVTMLSSDVQFPTTGQTVRRTILPETHRKIGCR